MEDLEHSINQRIALLVEIKAKGNKSSFARHIGVAPSVVSDILGSRKNKPGFDILNKVASAYNDVSTSWLLLGEGEMLLSPATSTGTNQIKNNSGQAIGVNQGNATQITLEQCERDLANVHNEVEQLKQQLATKDALLAAKDDLIAAKEEMLVLLRGSRNRPN